MCINNNCPTDTCDLRLRQSTRTDQKDVFPYQCYGKDTNRRTIGTTGTTRSFFISIHALLLSLQFVIRLVELGCVSCNHNQWYRYTGCRLEADKPGAKFEVREVARLVKKKRSSCISRKTRASQPANVPFHRRSCSYGCSESDSDRCLAISSS
jgi:hypothetical protein